MKPCEALFALNFRDIVKHTADYFDLVMRDPSKEQEALEAVNELNKETQESSVGTIQGNLESTAGEEKDSYTLSNSESTGGGSTDSTAGGSKKGTKTKSMTDDLGTDIELGKDTQEDTEDTAQEEKDSNSNADSTAGESKREDKKTKYSLRPKHRSPELNGEASGYESEGDDATWTEKRRSSKMNRYKGREELVTSGKVQVSGSKDMSDEFRNFLLNVKNLQKATADSYCLHLFLRKDDKSLLSHCRTYSGQNNDFHAANMTNFEDDTGIYVQVPSHTDWVYSVLPSKDPLYSSLQ